MLLWNIGAFVGAGDCDASTGFTSTGNLTTSRTGHTATLLPNGRVLVAGGRQGAELSSTELYDPATGVWMPTGNLAKPRADHTATLLQDGKVLVVGGFTHGGATPTESSAELYDPATGNWTATGSMATERGGHTATLLQNGKVLVAGGYQFDSVASAELYDPATGTWTSAGSMAAKRTNHTATLLPSGKVLVVAGFLGAMPSVPTRGAELYDPATGTWSITGNLIQARYLHTATLLANGKVLVAGGATNSGAACTATAELYDSSTGSWSSTGSLSAARSAQTSTLLNTNQVLVVGGRNSNGDSLNSSELYDSASATWSPGPNLTTSRYGHAATLLPSSEVLVAAGLQTVTSGQSQITTVLNSAELYVTVTPTLANISTRVEVGSGDNVLIAGFIIQGAAPKKVLIRAIGPSLANYGVSNPLADPQIELHDNAQIIGRNNDWRQTQVGGVVTGDQTTEIENSGLAPTDLKESALIATLSPGNYTAIVQGVTGESAIGSVEVYDLSGDSTPSKLANLSTRGFVRTSDRAMIGGIIIVNQPTRVLVRAMGPSLSQYGIANALGNPKLEIHDANSVIGRNDDWQNTQLGGVITSAQASEISATHLAPGDPAEAAIVATLQPGLYTAIVSGVDNAQGQGLIEVFSLP